jgi:hypothetical protein
VTELIGDGFPHLGVACRDEDVGTLPGKGVRGGLADPRGAAGDQNGSVVDAPRHGR